MRDFTDITVVLDRSGSMESIRNDTIGGYNRFLTDQQELGDNAALTLVQFDDQYEVLERSRPIRETPALTHETFVPRGWTALLDAIGRTINDTGARLAAIAESDRPDKVVFVILTDGHENASQEFSRKKVFEMISRQRHQWNWQFLFLGANQDAIDAGVKMGVAADASMSYAANQAGTRSAFDSTSGSVARYRRGQSAGAAYEQADRDAQKDAGLEQA